MDKIINNFAKTAATLVERAMLSIDRFINDFAQTATSVVERMILSIDLVINDFANTATAVAESVILLAPGPKSWFYWIVVGTFLALIALLLIWLAIRLRMPETNGKTSVTSKAEITFDEVTKQAAADAQLNQVHDDSPKAEAFAEMSERSVPSEALKPADGFKFFKKRIKHDPGSVKQRDPEDDVFLLGLEQEMLATRQLYLDGLISKEVYVMETQMLYSKAQTRMT